MPLFNPVTASSGGSTGASIAAPQPAAGTSLSGVTATAHASTHTKGDWVELIASTGFAAETLQVMILETIAVNATNTSMLLDIGTGPAASEVALISNLIVGHAQAVVGVSQQIGGPTFIFQGLAIAAGTRISARIQGAVSADTCKVGVMLRESGGPLTAGSAVTTYGADTATSNGTVPTVAGGTNTEAAFTQITASTSADIRSFIVSIGNAGAGAATAADGLIDIATGGAGSETVIVADIPYALNGNEQLSYTGTQLPFINNIAAGTRLSFRYQATSTNNASRPTVAIHGIN